MHVSPPPPPPLEKSAALILKRPEPTRPPSAAIAALIHAVPCGGGGGACGNVASALTPLLRPMQRALARPLCAAVRIFKGCADGERETVNYSRFVNGFCSSFTRGDSCLSCSPSFALN